ncbi:MAG: hypothetical protein KIT34_03825 [Cyanobacteria bacterium TGS_CYA1]|nr:hypothetical protein [Cyanobacteria bacterium TGS_CYA1]
MESDLFEESEIIPRSDEWFTNQNFIAFDGMNNTAIYTRDDVTVIVRGDEIIHFRMDKSSVRSMSPASGLNAWPSELVDTTETAVPEENVRFYRCLDATISPEDAQEESFLIDPTDALLGDATQRLIYVDISRKEFLRWRNAAGKILGTIEDPLRLPLGLEFSLREHVLSPTNSKRDYGLGFLNINNGLIEFVENARIGIGEDFRPVIPRYSNRYSQLTRYFPIKREAIDNCTFIVQGASSYFEHCVKNALEQMPKGLRAKLLKEIKTVKLNGTPRDGVKPKDLHRKPQGYVDGADMLNGPSWADTKSRQFTINEFCLNQHGAMTPLADSNAILTRFVHESVHLLDLSTEMQELLKKVYEYDLAEIPRYLRRYDDVKPESLGYLLGRDAEKIPSMLKQIATQDSSAVARAEVLSEISSILLTDQTNFVHGPDALLELFPNSRSVIERYLQSLE